MKTLLPILSSTLFIKANTKTVEESDTGALLSFPTVTDGALYNKSWEVSPAQFGYHAYGGSLEGVVIPAANSTFHKQCPREPEGLNPFIHYINDWFVGEAVTDYILMVDRLDCYFVDKIEVAQSLGASGVIICDWKSESLFTMWMPSDWKDDVDIPAVLLQKEHCETLYDHIGVTNWDPQNIENAQWPDEETIKWTTATIEWGLPHEDDRVEWQLWTSSNDMLGSEFKHNFNTTAIKLDLAGDTLFAPHMYILNGSHWGCDSPSVNSTGGQHFPCGRQCTNGGRYCSVDPEFDLEIGLDGLDVIQENLRSLCVWEYDKANAAGAAEGDFEGDDVVWWDYAVLWDENCGVLADSTDNFSLECSMEQMDALKPDQSLSQYVTQCVADSGGSGYQDGPNTLLSGETSLRSTSSIYAVPMVRVNEFTIHGNIDCAPPVTKASCEVLAAICAGFLEGTEPEVCHLTPAPTTVTCESADEDCSGECYGSHLVDECDQCLLVSSHEWNACIGCNGQADNAQFDCEGTCGGHYAVNDCGYCKDQRLPSFADFGKDCNGGCNMTLKEDRCGQCVAESDQRWDDCVGCDNVANSGKVFNECGYCLSPDTDGFDTVGKDCRGKCGDLYTFDECDECKAVDDDTRNDCLGCDGRPNSGYERNDCDECISVNDANFADYGKDCKGQCASSVQETHYVDECGTCLLPSDERWNQCVPEVTAEGGDLEKKESELTTIIVIVCVVAFLIVIAAAIIIGALKKRQDAIKERFDSLASTYHHMDSTSNVNFAAMNDPSNGRKKKKRTKDAVEDHSDDERL